MRRTRRPHLPVAFIAFLVFAAGMHAATTLVATPATVSLSYTKGGTLPTARVMIAPAGTTSSVYFTVKADTLPAWLQVDRTNGTGTAAAPVPLTFSPSLVAANSPAGTYSAAVEIDSTGLTPITVTVNMTVTNAAPTVTASLAILPGASWTPGTAIPTGILTVKSSGDPVYFTVTAPPSPPSAPAWINLSAPSAVAYSWGTPINVTFAPSAFDNPSVGASLTGTIVVRAGSTTLPTINVAITIGAPIATIQSISPRQMPQVIPVGAVRTIAVQGASFANGMSVKLGGAGGTAVTSNCATFASGTTDAWCLQSSGQFFLRLSSATLAGAAATANQINLYLSAGANGQPGQINIPVVTTPIVYAVTDAASFIQPAVNQYLNVVPYEMLSIFGDNFGTFGAAPGAAVGFTSGRLPNVLADANSNQLKVHFTDSTGNALAADSDGYLLLWTPSQINLLVPSLLPASSGGQELKATVWVGGAFSAPSNATTFNVVQASPALLTFGGGQGVVVNAVDNSINSSTNPARFGSTIVLYLSGMGDPKDGSALAGNSGPLVPSFAGCSTLASFLAASTVLHPTWATFDGAVVDSTVLGAFAMPPCFDPSTVSIKIGNVTLNTAVAYAGFTADSIAGLYQVNVVVPLSNNASLTGLTPPAAATATPYSIQVSIGGVSSQTGVNLYLAR
jgi:uncharacterized protein (TIGR03437 family)